MWTFVVIPATCWLCVLLAHPRRPLPDHEVEELVYARLLGRYQRLILVALIATGVGVFGLLTTVPRHVHAARAIAPPCALTESNAPSVCGPMEETDSWAKEPSQGN
jgi:hypothetical protein